MEPRWWGYASGLRQLPQPQREPLSPSLKERLGSPFLLPIYVCILFPPPPAVRCVELPIMARKFFVGGNFKM